MKKFFTVGGIAFGVLLIAALVILIFFPGLPTYFNVKKEFEHIDDTIPRFETVEVPVDYETYTVKGVSFKMPKGAETAGLTGSKYVYGGEVSVMVMESDTYADEQVMKEYDPEYDQWQYYDHEEKQFRHFFRTISEPYPDRAEASNDILWFIKGKLDSKMCLKLRGDDKDIFLELAEDKEEAYEAENTYRINGSGFSGYASESLGTIVADGLWTVNIYPDGGGSKYYFMMITGDNEEMKMQAISSIELAK